MPLITRSGLIWMKSQSGPTYPDAWVHTGLPDFALPGSQVTVPIFLGNQGRVLAAGAQLTLALPAGLNFRQRLDCPHLD